MENAEFQGEDDALLTGCGGIRLYSRWWKPDRPPRAVLVLVHGLCEHSGRYGAFAEHFTGRGFAVFSFDLRGHGQSPGRRGHAARLDRMLGDLEEALMHVRATYPDAGIVLYGHSLGGLLTAAHLVRDRSFEIRAAVISSPWIRLALPPAPLLVRISALLEKILPGLQVDSRIDPRELSRDAAVGEAYRADPLVHRRISVRLYHEVLRAIKAVWSGAGNIAVPVLIMHGEADRITDANESRRLAEVLGENATFLAWPDCRHELHHETNSRKVLEAVSEWLEKVLKQKRPE
jgi:alpha-beta hydrolase superfamily lysophospholipase